MTLPAWLDGQTVHDTDLLAMNAAINSLAVITTGGNSGVKSAIPSCKVLLNAGQSVNNNTDTLCSWNTFAWNNDNMWSSGSPQLVTIQTAGTYFIALQDDWISNATGIRAGKIFLNGTSNANSIAIYQINATNGFDTVMSAAAVFQANAGDVLRHGIFQTSGAALNVSTNFGGTWMLVHRLTN